MIGGLVLGAGTFVVGYLVCNDLSDRGNCVREAAGVGAIMLVAGAVTGALIGGGIEKKQPGPGTSDP